jgi:copper chaperone CopZ
LETPEGWSLCLGAACDVVYFRGVETVTLSEVRARPFHKSEDPARLVCFCFGHSARAVVEDVRTHGTSTIRAAIKRACKAGRDDCEHTNPQGRCCLGNVGQLLATVPSGTPDANTERSAPRATLPLIGAVVAALLSSACCWLPLVAIALGTSAAGAWAYFATWRIPLLIGAAVLLGAGFYLVTRKPRCQPGDACARPNRKLRRLNLIMLWASTALVAAGAFFPELASALAAPGEPATLTATETESTYRLEGMSCAGCAGEVHAALVALRGVTAASVSYESRSATVVWNGAPDDGAVAQAIAALGYRSMPLTHLNPSIRP